MENRDIEMGGLDREESRDEAIPSLLQIQVPSKRVAGFDCVTHESASPMDDQRKDVVLDEGSEVADPGRQDIIISIPTCSSPSPAAAATADSDIPYSISVSLPSSPSGFHIEQIKTVVCSEEARAAPADVKAGSPAERVAMNPPQLSRQTRFHSQPILLGNKDGAESKEVRKMPRSDSVRDKRFDHFKTWSGRLERQLSNLRGKPQEPVTETDSSEITEDEAVPDVGRYFDALEGPELDTLRATEVSALPDNENWPFLLRFPISAFGMCLGVSSQAILWKTLATAPSMRFLNVSPTVNLVLWCISLGLMSLISMIYLLKIIFYFEAVRREFYHPIRVNFFFAPWIACLFLVQGVPPSVAVHLHPFIWYALMAPIFGLELKIYGQWMSGGQRRLSKVANPSNHLSIVGNFVGALLGANMGLKEGPTFFFAVGLAHYLVLFVTLYQRLPTNVTLPKELHPVFFLFVAAPSVASMAWAKIVGDFDYGARIAYFIALFLYMSLAVRINFFRGFRFSLAWWAYTFPMTGASIATITYAEEVTNVLTRALSIGLSSIATVTVSALLVTTIIHAFVFRNLFPNDISIAVTRKRPKFSKILANLRSSSSDMKDLVFSISRSSPDSSVSKPSPDTCVKKGVAEP